LLLVGGPNHIRPPPRRRKPIPESAWFPPVWFSTPNPYKDDYAANR
jgi:hypothetical protein